MSTYFGPRSVFFKLHSTMYIQCQTFQIVPNSARLNYMTLYSIISARVSFDITGVSMVKHNHTLVILNMK